MIAALEPLFTAEFAEYRNVLTLENDPRPSLPLTRLLSPDCFSEQLTRFATQYGGGDRLGLVSLWSKSYFIRLLPPVVVALLVLDWRLPLALDRVEVVLDENALPQAFKLSGAGQAGHRGADDPFSRFDSLTEGHLRPFIDTLASQTGLSPRVLWSNAGNYLEWLLVVIAKTLPHGACAIGHGLLAAPMRPDGTRNPLFQPVRYLDIEGRSELKRQRRVCCLRYRVGELPYCANCPLQSNAAIR